MAEKIEKLTADKLCALKKIPVETLLAAIEKVLKEAAADGGEMPPSPKEEGDVLNGNE